MEGIFDKETLRKAKAANHAIRVLEMTKESSTLEDYDKIFLRVYKMPYLEFMSYFSMPDTSFDVWKERFKI